MNRRNWVAIPAVLAAAAVIATVVQTGDAGSPAGLLLVPLIAVTVPFLSLPLAAAFTIAVSSSLGIAYWDNSGSGGLTRVAVETPLIVTVAIVARHVMARL